VSGGAEVVTRTRTPREKEEVKTNTTRATLVIGSRNTIAMMRGVSWELASCTATSSAEDTNTMNVNIDEAMVPRTAWAVPGSMPDSRPIALSTG
jgi:hypothetical protein